ncbi:MAG TPA: hypothetical protein VIT91_17675 [Chthoniobacterales bacterium]
MKIANIRESSEVSHLVISPVGVKRRVRNDAGDTAFAFAVYTLPAYQTDNRT